MLGCPSMRHGQRPTSAARWSPTLAPRDAAVGPRAPRCDGADCPRTLAVPERCSEQRPRQRRALWQAETWSACDLPSAMVRQQTSAYALSSRLRDACGRGKVGRRIASCLPCCLRRACLSDSAMGTWDIRAAMAERTYRPLMQVHENHSNVAACLSVSNTLRRRMIHRLLALLLLTALSLKSQAPGGAPGRIVIDSSLDVATRKYDYRASWSLPSGDSLLFLCVQPGDVPRDQPAKLALALWSREPLGINRFATALTNAQVFAIARWGDESRDEWSMTRTAWGAIVSEGGVELPRYAAFKNPLGWLAKWRATGNVAFWWWTTNGTKRSLVLPWTSELAATEELMRARCPQQH